MAQGSSRAARVPPGGHELPREFIALHQRERIMIGLAEAVARRGYQAATVADIVKSARIARNTFYENFSGKEEAFLAALDHGVGQARTRVAAACEAAGSGYAARVRAGLEAFLAYVGEEPALARMAVVEALSAGPEAMDRYEAAIQSFVPLLRPGPEEVPSAAQLPETIEETILGGIAWIVYQRLVAGEAKQIGGMRAELVEFALTPYLGPEQARDAAQDAA